MVMYKNKSAMKRISCTLCTSSSICIFDASPLFPLLLLIGVIFRDLHLSSCFFHPLILIWVIRVHAQNSQNPTIRWFSVFH